MYANRKYCCHECYLFNNRTKNQNFEKNHTWIKNLISKKELMTLYLEQKLSVNAISKLKKVSPNVIYRRMKKYNIDKRDFYEQKRINSELGRTKESHKHQIVEGSKKRNRKNYLKIAKENKKWVCENCGKTETNKSFDLIVHHKDKNNKNNELSNLIVLCQNCHSYIHRKGRKFINGYKNGKN